MAQETDATRVINVITSLYPYDYYHDRYQEYYREGLRGYLQQRGGRLEVLPVKFLRTLQLLRRLRYSGRLSRISATASQRANSFMDGLAGRLGAQSRPGEPLVGTYTFRFENGREMNVCIDSHDSGEISDPSVFSESDVYFKTNYWIDMDYDPKTVALYNCNPLVLRHLAALRAMRYQPAKYDLCLVLRVWGGRNEVEGVEHCVRLLEAAARARGRKYLLAYLVAGDIVSLADRLKKSGIPTTTTPLPLRELWKVAAQSRVNVIRLGMHHCVPWRMCDLLALGACTVLDQPPKTVWPVPLREHTHYCTLNLQTSSDQPTASDASYRSAPDFFDALMADNVRVNDLRHAAADYFDQHLQPEHVGQYICESVMTRYGRSHVAPSTPAWPLDRG